jgi:uncharacterized protein YndB with AHSA1/START domain
MAAASDPAAIGVAAAEPTRTTRPMTDTAASDTADREIVATRVFDAPRELVFDMWTDPIHIAQWWGPKGFRNTIHQMDVRPGGQWRFVMHGPDGVDYKNEIVYTEVVRPERIAYDHVSGPRFRAVATFADEEGKTRLTVRMVFETAALRDKTAKEFGAVEGLNQTLGRLGEQLASTDPVDRPFIISRSFDAARERMFELWTSREHLMRWFGPKGFTMLYAKLDLRRGGSFHYRIRSPEGHEIWGKFVYREIAPPERIAWVNSFSDENGGLARHPGADAWPVEMLTTVTFAELQPGRTTVTVRWVPHKPTQAERTTFHTGRESMNMGWTGTFDQLGEYLARG